MNPLLHLDLASPLSYLGAFVLPAVDAVVPLVPSETAVITLGVATTGVIDVRIGVLVALAALGAWAGDNACFALGRRFGASIDRRIFAGERGARRRRWARETLERRGAALIVGCRFIPGGRTAVTVTCGATTYPRRAFGIATAVAGVLWAGYAFSLGRIGGRAFQDRPWAGLILALGVAVAASALIEAVRRLLAWRRRAGAAAAPRGAFEGTGDELLARGREIEVVLSGGRPPVNQGAADDGSHVDDRGVRAPGLPP